MFICIEQQEVNCPKTQLGFFPLGILFFFFKLVMSYDWSPHKNYNNLPRSKRRELGSIVYSTLYQNTKHTETWISQWKNSKQYLRPCVCAVWLRFGICAGRENGFSPALGSPGPPSCTNEAVAPNYFIWFSFCFRRYVAHIPPTFGMKLFLLQVEFMPEVKNAQANSFIPFLCSGERS